MMQKIGCAVVPMEEMTKKTGREKFLVDGMKK